MARPKEFDQERALHRAISIFSQKGFAATSTDDLMRAMDLGRQSMYDTFGGHHLLLSGAHWFIFQNAKIFPVQMVAWGLMLSVSSGCEMKT